MVRQPDDGPVSAPTEAYALRVAEAVLADGFRRLVEDDDTIRTVAEALAGVDGWEIVWPKPGEQHEELLVHYLTRSRVVVRALREDT